MPEAFNWGANANQDSPTKRGGKSVSGRSWGSHQEPAPGEYIVVYAGLGWRWLAGFIDYAPPTILLFPIKYVGFYLFWGFIAWNSMWLQGKTSQSLGKKLCGLRLAYIDEDETTVFDLYEVPGVMRCAIRFFAHILDLPLMWGLTGRIVFNWRKRTFADSVVTTVVIRDTRVHLFTREEAEADRASQLNLRRLALAAIFRDDREDADAERRAA